MKHPKHSMILQFIYDRLDRELWQKGVNVYRTTKMSPEVNDEGLISTNIADKKAPRGLWHTRLKLHFNGQVLT